MQRHEIVNLLAGGRRGRYLEIGVDWGQTFKGVKMADKHGVDPDFKVDPASLPGQCHVALSDAFFKNNNLRFDVVFIDGLHTYDQSKRDFENSWKCLERGGFVIIDDCRPPDAIAAISDVGASLKARAESGFPENMTWMGDVYKTIIWINDETEIAYAYIAENTNLAVAWQETAQRNRISTSISDIETFSFERFATTKFPVLGIRQIRRRIGRTQGRWF